MKTIFLKKFQNSSPEQPQFVFLLVKPIDFGPSDFGPSHSGLKSLPAIFCFHLPGLHTVHITIFVVANRNRFLHRLIHNFCFELLCCKAWFSIQYIRSKRCEKRRRMGIAPIGETIWQFNKNSIFQIFLDKTAV